MTDKTLKSLKRHHRTISVIGAFIVFGTFLAKDIKRDHLKDLGDAIDSAENAYVVRLDNRRTLSEINKLSQYCPIKS